MSDDYEFDIPAGDGSLAYEVVDEEITTVSNTNSEKLIGGNTEMGDYKLGPDEVILLKNETVAYGGKMAPYTSKLILTNQAVIVVQKGILGGVKDIKRFPFSSFKMHNGVPQAKSEKSSNGYHSLVLYLQDGEERFNFQNLTSIESQKWVSSIIQEVTGVVPERTFAAIPGAEFVAQSLKGTVDAVKNVFGIKAPEPEKASAKCPYCGASVLGIKGQSARCQYCDAFVSL